MICGRGRSLKDGMVSFLCSYSRTTLTNLMLGIRAYAARNHMRNMNAGDKAFFYHSNCKEPGIAGTMEIVKEFSEDSKFPHLSYTSSSPRYVFTAHQTNAFV